MRRDSRIQLSPPALYFSAGIFAGFLIGAFAGYLGRGMQLDERELVIQEDIWNPRGVETNLEDLLGAPPTLPEAPPSKPTDAEDWNLPPSEPTLDGSLPPATSNDAAAPAANAADPLGLAPEPGPSPANPSEESVDPGGLRLSDDPTRSFDAPDP